MATTSSLQNINWLPANKKVWAVYVKKKICLFSQSLYLPHTMFFFTFWNSKCIKTVGLELWLMWVKVIFLNINKIIDACAVLVNTSWLHNAWEMSLFFIKLKFLWKNGYSEKIKAHLPQHPQALQQLFCPQLFNFILKVFSPTPI